MDKKYIFFIDIDGTLVHAGKSVIDRSIVKEIGRLKQLGHIPVISTGRSLYSVLGIQGIEHFQYISVLFGSCLYDPEKKAFLKQPDTIPYNDVVRLVDYCTKNNIEWSYKDEMFEKYIFPDAEFYKGKKNCFYVPKEEYLSDLNNNKVTQMLVISILGEDIMKEFNNFDFYLMPGGYTDITLKGYNKSRCVEYFKGLYPDMTTVSIGDSSNDIAMFESTDISIAMGNSNDEIKQKATYVTKNIDDGGLIYAFRNILGL